MSTGLQGIPDSAQSTLQPGAPGCLSVQICKTGLKIEI